MSQIEVEKKFLLSPDQLDRLIGEAKPEVERSFTDIYFDDSSYSLTSKDIWLRERAGKFELKLPIENNSKYYLNQYHEITDEGEIYTSLNLKQQSGLAQDLKLSGITPFAHISTTRKSYNKDGFHIDVDQLDFGYNIVEIELLVQTKSEINDALNRIVRYAKNFDFTVDTSIKGKVIEYLYRNDKKHYQTLVDKGVVIEN